MWRILAEAVAFKPARRMEGRCDKMTRTLPSLRPRLLLLLALTSAMAAPLASASPTVYAARTTAYGDDGDCSYAGPAVLTIEHVALEWTLTVAWEGTQGCALVWAMWPFVMPLEGSPATGFSYTGPGPVERAWWTCPHEPRTAPYANVHVDPLGDDTYFEIEFGYTAPSPCSPFLLTGNADFERV